ncbi:Ctr copper transporter [Jimgerdemannia flammicorona]|uniref:Copper transport protein n=1 Tax=Jimgerdemannia flammicorona TaxID=994334 RepID=A0A433Q5K9_9FUNG|nr:Ctr copper transporter [Jimgerdemannia flammicorona]
MNHPDMQDYGHEMKCAMNMLFNWDTTNTCVIFSWWRIHNPVTLLLSCLAIFAVAASYEYLRELSRRYDEHLLELKIRLLRESHRHENVDYGNGSDETDGLLGKAVAEISLSHTQQALRSIVYTLLVAVSFFLMLVFMTYNGFLMGSVVAGAGTGYYFWGKRTLTTGGKPIQCH